MADRDENPFELSEAQIDALADAGNRALNDHYHEDLCACSAWPESCVSSGHYFAGNWDTAAFGIGMAAVIGAWEAMRATAEADELARLRRERDAFRDQRNGVFKENEQLIARVEESGEARLRAENETRTAQREIERLRARMAELEAAQAPADPYPPKTSYVVEMDGMLSPLGYRRSSIDEARKNVAAYRARFPDTPYRIVRWMETSAVVEESGEHPVVSPRG
ncbi:hypothetical protein [Streptomyces sp. NPDC056387]|uniref:hypothetical protein n=1 Tax=Streptomyces sp. NPDC056387 TaxID=3345803 RepID=UPI0035DF32F4